MGKNREFKLMHLNIEVAELLINDLGIIWGLFAK